MKCAQVTFGAVPIRVFCLFFSTTFSVVQLPIETVKLQAVHIPMINRVRVIGEVNFSGIVRASPFAPWFVQFPFPRLPWFNYRTGFNDSLLCPLHLVERRGNRSVLLNVAPIVRKCY